MKQGHVLGLTILVALGLAISVKQSKKADSRPAASQLVVIGIGRYAWAPLLSQYEKGNLPVLKELINHGAVWGDLVSMDSGDGTNVLVSILTGRHAHNHEIAPEEWRGPRKTETGPENRLIWDWIGRSGRSVRVTGFPLWSPSEDAHTHLMAAPSYLSRELREGAAMNTPLRLPSQVPSDVVHRLLEGLGTNSLVEEQLRLALASDLTVVDAVLQSQQHLPGADMFVYLEGLTLLENSLADFVLLDPHSRTELVERYHVFVDGLLGRILASIDLEQANLFVFSEDGHQGLPLSYRPRFPQDVTIPTAGVLLATGCDIRSAYYAPLIAPVDLAMMWLYLTATPIPSTMDGVIHTGLLKDDYVYRHTINVGH